MKILNRIVKWLAWLAVQIIVIAELYVFSALAVSPFLLVYIMATGNAEELLTRWVLVAVPVCLVMFIYVLIKARITTKKK